MPRGRGTIRVIIDSATAASARRRLAGLLPTWALLIVGVGMVVAGAIVATRPDLSITVLVVLVGGGLAAAGSAKILSAGQERRPWLERSLGIALLLVGVVAVAWHGTTVQVLARLIGIGLLLSGVGNLASAIGGSTEERLASAVGGLAGWARRGRAELAAADLVPRRDRVRGVAGVCRLVTGGRRGPALAAPAARTR